MLPRKKVFHWQAPDIWFNGAEGYGTAVRFYTFPSGCGNRVLGVPGSKSMPLTRQTTRRLVLKRQVPLFLADDRS